MVRFGFFLFWLVFQFWWLDSFSHVCRDWADEEEEENTEDQDEQGNLRGLIDDGDEEEEESQRSASGGASDSEEELKHHRKKRSGFSLFTNAPSCVHGLCSSKTYTFVFGSFSSVETSLVKHWNAQIVESCFGILVNSCSVYDSFLCT